MTKARQDQVSLEATPFYHCYVRCVRRAYLCGDDFVTAKNYDHRKQWIVSRLRFLSYVYAIDVCAYAVMSNHYHVVLHVDQARAEGWTQREVVERWMQIYRGSLLVDRWLVSPSDLDEASSKKVSEIIEQWRQRLYDLGWFMRGINETIARMANEEENCKGRFWEGRYKSQALLDEAALLSCMAYVDLNPIRAGVEAELAESDFTSIQSRLYDYAVDQKKVGSSLNKRMRKQKSLEKSIGVNKDKIAPLMPFDGSAHTDIHCALPFTREDYFDLVDKTGRVVREDKAGFIDSEVPSVIVRFGINPDHWIRHIQRFGRNYSHGAGAKKYLQRYAALFEQRWVKGVSNSALVYQ